MNIEVLFFAQVRESLGTDRKSLTVSPGVTVAEVLAHLAESPEWQTIKRLPMRFAVNEQVVDTTHALRDGDRVALLTPVSGG